VSRHDYNRINKRMRKGMCLQKFVSISKNEYINKNKQKKFTVENVIFKSLSIKAI